MAKHTMQELYQWQALPLNIKVLMTAERIRNWVNEFGEDGVYLSFSSGKDSTVLGHIIRVVCGYKNIPFVFVDVPTQYPELKQFAKTFDNLVILKPKISFAEVCEKYGFPMISKEVSNCVSGARKYVKYLDSQKSNNTILTDRQTDRQTELNVIKLLQYVFGYAVVKLDDIVDFRNGKGHEKNIIDNGKYIVVNSKFVSTNGEVKKYSDQQICPLYKNDILMVMSDLPNGRALAKCYLVEENDKYTLNQRIGAFTVNRTHLISTKYLYYVLNRNRQLLRYDNGADQTNLRKNDILNISIAIPTIEEQQKITDILDRFDSICNDLSIGLPAEIEARKKQYEYYRDKLLTFKELQK